MSDEIIDAESETTDSKAIVVAPVSGNPLAAHNPIGALENAQAVIRFMADKCKGPKFISKIQDKDYPRVEWWTTVGASMGMFPVEAYCKRVSGNGQPTTFEARVEVRRANQIVSAASAICSAAEPRWSNQPEYAVRSMAITRATAKAYRLGLSFMAVLAGLEATPAEEIEGLRNQTSQRPAPRPAAPAQTAAPRPAPAAAPRPQPNSAPQQPQAPVGMKSSEFTITKVQDRVEGKSGKLGPYRVFANGAMGDVTFSTFSDTEADSAKVCADQGLLAVITWTEKTWNGQVQYDLQTCAAAPGEGDAPADPDDGASITDEPAPF